MQMRSLLAAQKQAVVEQSFDPAVNATVKSANPSWNRSFRYVGENDDIVRLKIRYVYIPLIHSVSTATSTFSLRVDIDMLWTASEKDKSLFEENPAEYLPDSYVPTLVFQNGIDIEVTNVASVHGGPFEIKSNGDNFLRVKVVGSFAANFDVRNFPFDEQVLPLLISVAIKSRKELQFIPEDVDKELMYVIYQYKPILEWNVTRCKLKTLILDEFAHMECRIYVKRIPWNFVIRQMLPLSLISVLANVCFVIDDKSGRLSYLVTLLLTSVAMQLNVSSQLPPSPYLSFADIYAFSALSYLSATIVHTNFAPVDENKNIINGAAPTIFVLAFCSGFFLFYSYAAIIYHRVSLTKGPDRLCKQDDERCQVLCKGVWEGLPPSLS